MSRNVGLVFAFAFSLATAPAQAEDAPYKFKLLIGGGYETGSIAFSRKLTESQFQETATIDTAYSADKAPGFDLALQWNAFKHVGVSVGGTLYNRDLSGSFTASFPHPLYFQRPRSASGSVSGKLKETAGHLNVVFFGHSGSFDLSAWGGASLFKVEADLLENVLYSQSYPYDSVTVTTTPQAKVKDSPIGFNLGASADWRFAKSVGVGIQGRYARAKAKFPVTPAADVDAGGFQAGAGLRFYF